MTHDPPSPAESSPNAPPPRVYAAELDDATCATCAAHAGLEYAPDDSDAPAIPNPACMCPGGCRCTWL